LQIASIHQQLSVHHSKDKQFLRRLKAAMMEAATTPWRCHWCKRLNKYFATKCGSCYLSWEKCIDIHYVHGQKQQAAASPRASSRKKWSQPSDWTQWGSSTTTQAKQVASPRKRPKTPKKAKEQKGNYGTPALDPPWQSSALAPMPSQTTQASTGSMQATILQELVTAIEQSDQPVPEEI